MASASGKVGSNRSSSQHELNDCLYEIYALECEPEWQLPLLFEPRLTLNSRDHPLTEVPRWAFRHRNYHQSTVYDAADPCGNRKRISAWKVFADAADTVYYVGQTENFDTRIAEHRSGRGSNLTAEASVEEVAIRQQYPQNLKDAVIEALDHDIDSRESSLDFAVSFGVLSKAEKDDQITQLEGVIELFSHRDDCASRIVSAFVVGDCDDEAQTQREEHLRSCMDAASGVRSPEAAALD